MFIKDLNDDECLVKYDYISLIYKPLRDARFYRNYYDFTVNFREILMSVGRHFYILLILNLNV